MVGILRNAWGYCCKSLLGSSCEYFRKGGMSYCLSSSYSTCGSSVALNLVAKLWVMLILNQIVGFHDHY